MIAHGNLDFTPTQVTVSPTSEGMSALFSDGIRMVVVYVIHKRMVNNVEQVKTFSILQEREGRGVEGGRGRRAQVQGSIPIKTNIFFFFFSGELWPRIFV